MNELVWLQNFFQSMCNGDWEHGDGLKFETLDNPGWKVDFSLVGTLLEDKDFQPVVTERSEVDWIHCTMDGGVFRARCGPLNLLEVVAMFRSWVVGSAEAK